MAIFNWPSYITQQSQAILEYFNDRWGICEITGEFLHEDFLNTIVDWYNRQYQSDIITYIIKQRACEIFYCINAKHIVRDKQIHEKYLSFEKYILKALHMIHSICHIKAKIIITMIDKDFIPPHIRELEEILHTQWYSTQYFYEWAIIPRDENKITFVTSYGTDTAKTTLCESWSSSYAIRSSLPIYNLPQSHPINILAQAYEYLPHSENTIKLSIMYNYINTDNIILSAHCKESIVKRIELHKKLLASWYGDEEALEKCEYLLTLL